MPPRGFSEAAGRQAGLGKPSSVGSTRTHTKVGGFRQAGYPQSEPGREGVPSPWGGSCRGSAEPSNKVNIQSAARFLFLRGKRYLCFGAMFCALRCSAEFKRALGEERGGQRHFCWQSRVSSLCLLPLGKIGISLRGVWGGCRPPPFAAPSRRGWEGGPDGDFQAQSRTRTESFSASLFGDRMGSQISAPVLGGRTLVQKGFKICFAMLRMQLSGNFV